MKQTRQAERRLTTGGVAPTLSEAIPLQGDASAPVAPVPLPRRTASPVSSRISEHVEHQEESGTCWRVEAPSSSIRRMLEPSVENPESSADTGSTDRDPQAEGAAASKIQAAWRRHFARQIALYHGDYVRENVVQVRSLGDGIIHTRVHGGGDEDGVPQSSPLGNLRATMSEGAQYDRLTVLNGAANGRVVEHQATSSSPAEAPNVLAQKLSSSTAFINGGFYSPVVTTLKNDEGNPVTKGLPVGPTMNRPSPGNEIGNHTPIPGDYADAYGHLRIDGSIGLSSGPLLAVGGEKNAIPNDDRYRYKVTQEGRLVDNPNNLLAGALTHAGDKNARSAISTTDTGHAVLHALTPGDSGKSGQSVGATMQEWQDLTDTGARVPHPQEFQQNAIVRPDAVRPSTLNLDGGGSVFMGVRRPDHVEPITGSQRQIANIVGARSNQGELDGLYGRLSMTSNQESGHEPH